ncbi:MAG: hypothetical protein HOQ27_13040, partial [Dermatophilaceae bacterium]|nr:hypothetical protein [Dermatophilaceae bacterium]
AAEKAAAGRAASAASAFGAPGPNGQGADADPMAGFDPANLPKGFEKFLGKG